MARRETAARRYADAAFEIGRADGTLDRWAQDLARFAELFALPDLRALLEHPAIPFVQKERILRRVSGDGVAREAMNLILLMVRRGLPRSVPRMVEHFNELLRRQRGIERAEIRSALPLDDEERSAIADRLRQLTHNEIEISEQVDPLLIGGIAVRIGDQLYDASVRSRLERLRARLTTA
jgi:F-type H+-transporting ATPase subunit delta